MSQLVPDNPPLVIAQRGLTGQVTFTVPSPNPASFPGATIPAVIPAPWQKFQMFADIDPWPAGAALTLTSDNQTLFLVQSAFAPPMALLASGQSYTITPSGFPLGRTFGFRYEAHLDLYQLAGLGHDRGLARRSVIRNVVNVWLTRMSTHG